MEVRVEGKCGPLVNNVDEVLRQIQQQLQDQQEQWVAQLRDHRRSSLIWKLVFIKPFKVWRIKSSPGCWPRSRRRMISPRMPKKSSRAGTAKLRSTQETTADGAAVGRFVVVGDDVLLCRAYSQKGAIRSAWG